MKKYILVTMGNGDTIDYPIDTDDECTTARDALLSWGQTSEMIYAGDSQDPSSYATGERFRVDV